MYIFLDNINLNLSKKNLIFIEDKIFTKKNFYKINFKLGNIKLTSKVIDGKFPDYTKVVPANNEKELIVSTTDFINSIKKINSVSLD